MASPVSQMASPVSQMASPFSPGGGVGKAKAKGKDKEDRWWWLTPEKIRDAEGRRPDHAEYDAATLYVPPSVSLAPFERQYWDVKSRHMDTVVFFKKGKFYELYEMDADIGKDVLELKMTQRVNMRMVGVPESSFQPWATKLVAKGYKVARCEQMETPEQAQERKKASKSREVCKRELVQMYSAGTLNDPQMVGDHNAPYLLALKEGDGPHEFGVCFADTTTGHIHVGAIRDDARQVQLEMMLLQLNPSEVLVERGRCSAAVRSLVKQCCGNARVEVRTPGAHFWSFEDTEQYLGSQFAAGWPAALEPCREDPLVMGAVGAVVQFLDEAMIAKEVLSMARFEAYNPGKTVQSKMVLDGRTLANLEVLCNGEDGKEAGSLLSVLDRCLTPMGHRMFRKWVCYPLMNPTHINNRLDAVDDLNANPELLDLLCEGLGDIPDLERLTARIHSDAHYNSQAIMFDNVNAKKLRVFLTALRGCKRATSVLQSAASAVPNVRSGLLKSGLTAGGRLDEIHKAVRRFEAAFDWDKAEREGHLAPNAGADEEFDKAEAAVIAIENELEAYLQRAKAAMKGARLKWKHTQAFKYQIEVPNAELSRVTSEFTRTGQTKTSTSFRSPFLDRKVEEWDKATEHRDSLLANSMQRMFGVFDEAYALWSHLASVVALVDCLCGLAKQSMGDVPGLPMCRPQFVEDEGADQFGGVQVKQMRHPTLQTRVQCFVPNDLEIGFEEARGLIVTGPNMGGKSTMLRQACLAVIMAQIGAHVPAASMRLRCVDRVYTRLGASDRIMSGQSTFMVELTETSNLLRHATPRSLVILDELGRGTSTFDGYAIAHAVLAYILDHVKCMCLFATHYHAIPANFADHPHAANFQMEVFADNSTHSVTHTFRFTRGVCSKSYGTNVAAMAGVAHHIVDAAHRYSQEFESRMSMKAKDGAKPEPEEREGDKEEGVGEKEDECCHVSSTPESVGKEKGGQEMPIPPPPLTDKQRSTLKQLLHIAQNVKDNADMSSYLALMQLWNSGK